MLPDGPAPPPLGCVLLLGATSPVGSFLIPRLSSAGARVVAVSRRRRLTAGHEEATWIEADISSPDFRLADLPAASTLISLVPLALLPPLLRGSSPTRIKRIVAFGSTSLYTKAGSRARIERALAGSLSAAERDLEKLCAQGGVPWTVLRPTMVYTDGTTGVAGFIERMVKRLGFVPLAGRGGGFVQPVHADDLAVACLQVLRSGRTLNRAYNLSGADRMTYREMVERISRNAGRPVHIVHLPVFAFRLLVRVLALLPRFRKLSPEIAVRMNADLSFDHEDATRDFGFRPRAFGG